MTASRGDRWFRPPPAWAIAIGAAFALGAIWLVSRGGWIAALASLSAAASWPTLASLRPPNRHRAAHIAAVSIALTLIVTWATASVIVGVYLQFIPGEGPQVWMPVLLPAALNVGGLLALFRSIQTRTETSAALRELSSLRTSVLSSPLVEASVRALEADDLETLLGRLQQMLQLAVGLSLLPRAVDRGSVWVRAEAGWTILASTHSASGQSLVQPVLPQPQPGGGMVACLAAHVRSSSARPSVDFPAWRQRYRNDVLLVADRLEEHPWFMPNPTESRKSQGIAMVLLRHRGEVAGAVCLTCASDAVPTQGPEAEEMIDILAVWAHAFATAIGRFYDVTQVAEHAD